MNDPTAVLGQYLPVLMMFGVAMGLGTVIVVLGAWLGPKRPNPVKLEPFECGIEAIGPANVRFSVKFYMMALLFLLFDVEFIFLVLWAIVFRSGSFSATEAISFQWFAFIEMSIFLSILVTGLIYAWRKGALNWQ